MRSSCSLKRAGPCSRIAGPGRQVDAHSRAVAPRQLDRPESRGVDRRGEKRIAGDVQSVAGEPGRVEVLRSEARRGSSIRGHRPFAVGRDERDDDAVPSSDRADELHAARLELGGHEPAGWIVAAFRDTSRLRAEGDGPGGDVRGLSADGEARLGERVGAGFQWFQRAHDHVEEHVTEGDHLHPRPRIVSWTATRGAGVSARSSSAESWAHRRRSPPRGDDARATGRAHECRRGSTRSRARPASARSSTPACRTGRTRGLCARSRRRRPGRRGRGTQPPKGEELPRPARRRRTGRAGAGSR